MCGIEDKKTKRQSPELLSLLEAKRFAANSKNKQRGSNIFNVELVGLFGGEGSLFIIAKN